MDGEERGKGEKEEMRKGERMEKEDCEGKERRGSEFVLCPRKKKEKRWCIETF